MDYPGGLEKSCIKKTILRIGKSFEFQMSPGLWESIKVMYIYRETDGLFSQHDLLWQRGNLHREIID